MATYLDRILAAHRAAAGQDRRKPDHLVEAARSAPPPRAFARALARTDELGVVAEGKGGSPSKGDLAPGLVPAQLAHAYAQGGARCLWALGCALLFGGSARARARSRAGPTLPALRKRLLLH